MATTEPPVAAPAATEIYGEQKQAALEIPKVATSDASTKEPLALKFGPATEGEVLSLDWSSDGESLAYGHSLGVSLLNRQLTGAGLLLNKKFQQQWVCAKAYYYLGAAAVLLRTEGDFIAAGHSDYTISLINTDSGEILNLSSSSGHHGPVNGIDLTSAGVVASVGWDRKLLVWEDGRATPFPLGSVAKKVKFWDDSQSEKVVVLEGGYKLRVLDWRKGQWLATIYLDPEKGAARDIGIYNSDLLVVGDGWWKRFNVHSLSGGCGYTPATDEGSFLGGAASDQPALTSITQFSANHHIGHVTETKSLIYNLDSYMEHGSEVEASILEPKAVSLRRRGDVMAVASGTSIYLVRNRYLELQDNNVLIIDD